MSNPADISTTRRGTSVARPLRRAAALMCLVACGAGGARGEDVVIISSAAADGGRATIRGQIVDYTGESITLARGDAAPRSYPAERVVDIETEWEENHQAAREALAAGEFDAAAKHLTEANRRETRVWVRRLILADLMRCYEALGRPEQAGELLIAIAQSDSATPAFGAAPLAWWADDRVPRAKAESWLGRHDQPAAVLLGASYLMATSGAALARPALTELARHSHPTVAALAEAQLWRSQVVNASPADAARWAARIEQMPAQVRAGPYFVLAQTYQRLDMVDDAALAYLRLPVLFPDRRELSTRALATAGRLLEQAGRGDEAALLFAELRENFPESAEAGQTRMLQSPPAR